jgi:hypothetical protein
LGVKGKSEKDRNRQKSKGRDRILESCAAETGWGTEDGICDLHPFQKREEYRGVVAGERVGANQHIENRE